MNTLLKAVMKEIADLVKVGKDVAAKCGLTVIMGDLFTAGTDVPSIIANIEDFKPELEALISNPSADADLLAYASGLVGGETAKAQAVVGASAKLLLNLGLDIKALVDAIESPAAAPAPATPAAPTA